MTKQTAKQQAVLQLLLEDYPGAKDLPKRQQQALAEVYAAEGAAGVERILVAEKDDGLPCYLLKDMSRKPGDRLYCVKEGGCTHTGGAACEKLDLYHAAPRAKNARKAERA